MEYPKNLELIEPICKILKHKRYATYDYYEWQKRDGLSGREPYVHLIRSYNDDVNTIAIEFSGSPPRFPIYIRDIHCNERGMHVSVDRNTIRSANKIEWILGIVCSWLLKYDYFSHEKEFSILYTHAKKWDGIFGGCSK